MKMNSAYQRLATRLSALGLSCLLAAGTACIPAEAAAPGTALRTSSFFEEQRQQLTISSAKWKKVGKNLRLKSSSGKYKKGMVKYNGSYYYFDSKGNLKTGFITYKKKTYYASYVKGAKGKGQILTGLVYISGNYYYLNPSSKPYPGAVSTGFQTIGGRRYYFDAKGRMLTGWISTGGSRYYANPGTTGYHGALLTGTQTVDGVTCRFAADGRLEGTVPAASPSNTNAAANTLMTSFRPLYQYPELPTGCETTSLAMVLNYKGVPADKVNLANNYLDKGPVGKVSPWKAFVGDPRNSSAHGCYAPVVVNMANRYLTEKKSKLRASYISGRELETLAAYTSAGNPVIVWGTINCRAPYHSKTWVIDGQKIEWISPEHCVVLLGFRGTQVVIADPWTGRIVSYEKEVFRKGYNALHKQAVVIR